MGWLTRISMVACGDVDEVDGLEGGVGGVREVLASVRTAYWRERSLLGSSLVGPTRTFGQFVQRVLHELEIGLKHRQRRTDLMIGDGGQT